jgi:hypothetical protein
VGLHHVGNTTTQMILKYASQTKVEHELKVYIDLIMLVCPSCGFFLVIGVEAAICCTAALDQVHFR